MKKIILVLTLLLGLTGCISEADQAANNLHKEIEEFRVPRQIVATNTIKDTVLLQVVGYCSIETANSAAQGTVEITCKTEGGYTKDFVYLADNVTFTVEQLSPSAVSGYKRKFIFKPGQIIPLVEIDWK